MQLLILLLNTSNICTNIIPFPGFRYLLHVRHAFGLLGLYAKYADGRRRTICARQRPTGRRHNLQHTTEHTENSICRSEAGVGRRGVGGSMGGLKKGCVVRKPHEATINQSDNANNATTMSWEIYSTILQYIHKPPHSTRAILSYAKCLHA